MKSFFFIFFWVFCYVRIVEAGSLPPPNPTPIPVPLVPLVTITTPATTVAPIATTPTTSGYTPYTPTDMLGSYYTTAPTSLTNTNGSTITPGTTSLNGLDAQTITNCANMTSGSVNAAANCDAVNTLQGIQNNPNAYLINPATDPSIQSGSTVIHDAWSGAGKTAAGAAASALTGTSQNNPTGTTQTNCTTTTTSNPQTNTQTCSIFQPFAVTNQTGSIQICDISDQNASQTSNLETCYSYAVPSSQTCNNVMTPTFSTTTVSGVPICPYIGSTLEADNVHCSYPAPQGAIPPYQINGSGPLVCWVGETLDTQNNTCIYCPVGTLNGTTCQYYAVPPNTQLPFDLNSGQSGIVYGAGSPPQPYHCAANNSSQTEVNYPGNSFTCAVYPNGTNATPSTTCSGYHDSPIANTNPTVYTPMSYGWGFFVVVEPALILCGTTLPNNTTTITTATPTWNNNCSTLQAQTVP